MIYYTSFLLFTLMYLFLKLKYNNKIFLYFIIALAIIFSSLRYDAGNDFFNYYSMLLGFKSYGNLELFNRLILDLSIYLEYPQLFYIITSFIYIVVLVIALKELKFFNAITVFIFISFTLSFLTSFGFVRQFLAISFVFLALAYIRNKKYLFSFFSFFISIGFHLTGIIYILGLIYYFLFARTEKNVLVYVILLLISFFTFEYIIYFISASFDLYLHYFLDKESPFGKNIFYLLVLIFLVSLFLGKLKKIKDRNFWFTLNMGFLSLLLYSALLNYGEHIVRISYYFIPFFYIFISSLYNNLHSRVKKLYFIFITSICFFTYFSTLYFASINSTRDFLTNYQFYFFVN